MQCLSSYFNCRLCPFFIFALKMPHRSGWVEHYSNVNEELHTLHEIPISYNLTFNFLAARHFKITNSLFICFELVRGKT